MEKWNLIAYNHRPLTKIYFIVFLEFSSSTTFESSKPYVTSLELFKGKYKKVWLYITSI